MHTPVSSPGPQGRLSKSGPRRLRPSARYLKDQTGG